MALGKTNGSDVFTGYVVAAPEYEYLGWGEQGPVYRYNLAAQSDEILLDQKALPNRSPFVVRSAGNALRQLAQDLLPGEFDTSEVQDVDTLASYAVNPQKNFSFHAAEIALACRGSFRCINGALILAPVGTNTYSLDESDANFSPAGLWLNSPNLLVNDVTVIGLDEPQAYVRDYFAGDGESLTFYLSQTPFAQTKPALIDEEYLGPGLDTTTWVVNDPSSAVSVAAQTLQIAGGTRVDGRTTVELYRRDRTGSSVRAATRRRELDRRSLVVMGGLYAGTIQQPDVGGFFRSRRQAWVRTSRRSSVDQLRARSWQPRRSPIFLHDLSLFDGGLPWRGDVSFFVHPAGSGWGGAAVDGGCPVRAGSPGRRSSNPETLIAPATVFYDVYQGRAGILHLCVGKCDEYAVQHPIHLCCAHTAGGGANSAARCQLRYATGRSGGQRRAMHPQQQRDAEFLRAILAGIESAHCGELSRVWTCGGSGGERGECCDIAEGR